MISGISGPVCITHFTPLYTLHYFILVHMSTRYYQAQYALPKTHPTIKQQLYIYTIHAEVHWTQLYVSGLIYLIQCVLLLLPNVQFSAIYCTQWNFAMLRCALFQIRTRCYTLYAIRYALGPILARIRQWCWIGRMMKRWLWKNCCPAQLMISEGCILRLFPEFLPSHWTASQKNPNPA